MTTEMMAVEDDNCLGWEGNSGRPVLRRLASVMTQRLLELIPVPGEDDQGPPVALCPEKTAVAIENRGDAILEGFSRR